MGVTVIFSDGSKRMAHNTNDLRERWELRRDPVPSQISAEIKQGYAVPLVDETSSDYEVGQAFTVYTAVIAALNLRLSTLRDFKRMSKERAQLRMVYQQVMVYFAQVKALHKERNIKSAQAKERQDYEVLKSYTRELERIVLSGHLSLPPKPFEGWLTADELDRRQANKQKEG